MKADDSSLDDAQFHAVSHAARRLLDRSSAWGVFPTPVHDLLAAANLKTAPISAFDENAMLHYIRMAGDGAGRLLRRAAEKVRGILDVHAATIHVDETVTDGKQTFLKLHETAHFELPHQRGLFRWIQDCDKNLSPEIADLFEREANTFARIVLFQDDTFAKASIGEPFGIKVPINIGRKFGASVYASLREYVRRHHQVCAVIALEPIQMMGSIGMIAKVSRTEVSARFSELFGPLILPEFLSAADNLWCLVPLGDRRMSSPRSLRLLDSNGERHEFVAESFKTKWNIFILIHSH